MNFIIYILLLFGSLICWSFPENVRHGYFTCVACHVSPSGGGVLTPYGRSLSAELMSTWGTPKTAGIFFTDNEDETKTPPWFRANVFLRSVQTYRNSSTVEKARHIPMQADLETGIDTEKFAAIITLGYRAENPRESADLNEFFSRRHYIMYRPTESLSLRGGKFMFSFGLNGPDHITATRRGLSWDQGSESYNLELAYSTERASTIATWIDNSPQEKGINKDKGVAINQSFFIGEDSKVGISAFAGGRPDFDKHVVGPYWIWSFTKNLFLDSEIFFQDKRIKSNSTTEKGYATFHRLGYEAIKGFIPFLQFDRSFLNESNRNSQFDSYGMGLQWLPYPHFETTAFVGKEKPRAADSTDFAWLMLHVYL